MLTHLAQKIQRDSELRALLSINNTAKRIYTYLMQMQKQSQEPGAPIVVENLPTHQDIANMVNTSRETVTRALLTLTQLGIAQKDAHRLIIRDPEGLKKLAHGV
jgi:CRP-like cAMP-binding protein